jgi:hypothetical protein
MLEKNEFEGYCEAQQHNVVDLLDKIHSDRTSNGSVGERVCNVTPIVGKPATDIMIHATTRSQNSMATPSFHILVSVRLGSFLSCEVRLWDSLRASLAQCIMSFMRLSSGSVSHDLVDVENV